MSRTIDTNQTESVISEQTVYKFKLKKPFGKFKKGKLFDCMGGLLSGITCDKTRASKSFEDTEWFSLVEEKIQVLEVIKTTVINYNN